MLGGAQSRLQIFTTTESRRLSVGRYARFLSCHTRPYVTNSNTSRTPSARVPPFHTAAVTVSSGIGAWKLCCCSSAISFNKNEY